MKINQTWDHGLKFIELELFLNNADFIALHMQQNSYVRRKLQINSSNV